jgi:hypothetical protein
MRGPAPTSQAGKCGAALPASGFKGAAAALRGGKARHLAADQGV